jgi:catechol 2,3-dioxygenase-like lactoylglutathione lyase family enzyme
VTAKTLDHVALWVADRDAIADYVVANLGMHVIERTDRFTLLGADARRFKLTLFAEEGPRDRGALKHVTLRTNEGREGTHDVGEGLVVNVVRGPAEVDYDLDHVAIFSRDPEATAREYLSLGFNEAAPQDGVPRVELGGAYLEFHAGGFDDSDRPLLNHLAVLVDRAEGAKELPAEVADVVDAPNTYAVFVWGPERVKLEYVEHKPTFSLV